MERTRTPLTPEHAAKVNAEAGTPRDVTDVNPSWAWTAGSAISKLHDLNIWAKVLATGTLLSPTSQRERLTWTAMSPAPGGPNYGLGIVDFDGFLGHDGGLPSFQSWMGYQPDKHATVIVLTNLPTAPDSTPCRLTRSQRSFASTSSDPATHVSPPLIASSHTGAATMVWRGYSRKPDDSPRGVQ